MRKRSLLAMAMALVCFAGFCDPIRVGSFNLQIFADTKEARPNLMHALGVLTGKFDVIALQEVGSNGSKASGVECKKLMDAYVAKVEEATGVKAWAYVTGDQFAFVYRMDKLALLDSGPYSGSQAFTYRPLTAHFKAVRGDFDFALVTVHTRPELAEKEIGELKTAMTETVARYGTPNVICLGDYNGDGHYYLAGLGHDLRGFDGYVTVIPNGADTTSSPTTHYAYDRIEMTEAAASHFTKTYGIIVPSQSMDVSKIEGPKTTRGTDEAISDHYPVWCEFSDSRVAE